MGAGTALFVCGTCFAPGARVSALTLLVDGNEQPLVADGMPRLDLLPAGRAGGLPRGVLGLRANRAAARRRDARIRPPPHSGRGEVVARIAVAEPRAPLPGAPQSRSAWPHSSRRWSCSPAGRVDPRADAVRLDLHRQRRLLGPSGSREMASCSPVDPRFVLSRSDRRRGFCRNFERALELVPAARATSPWPTRTMPGTRTSSRRWCAMSATPGSSTATSGSCHRTAR